MERGDSSSYLELIGCRMCAIVVYTRQGCQPCKATVRLLTELEVDFVTRPVEDLPADELRALSLIGQTLPIVVFDRSAEPDDISCVVGFDPVRLRELAM